MKTLFGLLFYFVALASWAQSPQEVLQMSLEKLGGKAAWAKAKNAHLLEEQRGDNPHSIEMYYEFPHNAYFNNQYANKSQNITAGMRQEQAWVRLPNDSVITSTRTVSGEATFMGLLFYYADSLHYPLELLEDKIINGKLCWQLVLERQVPITVYVDKFSLLPVASKSAISYTLYKQFVVYEPLGIWVEVLKNNMLTLEGNQIKSSSHLSAMRFNVELPKGIFEVPKR